MDAREVEELIERLCDDYLRQLVTEDRIGRRGPSDDEHRDSVEWALEDAMEFEADRLDRGKVDHIVGDRPSRAISKEDVHRYRLTLDKLPAHLGVRHKGLHPRSPR